MTNLIFFSKGCSMRKIISLLSVFIILYGVMSIPEVAQAGSSINASGANDLKKQIEDSLQWRNDMAKTLGQGLTMEGDVEVNPKSSFYEVKLPRISFTFGPSGKLDIGTITATATPDPSGGWLTNITLPSIITFYDKTNAPVSDITIGSQHFSGIWMPAKKIYSKFDSLYQDIQVRSIAPEIFTVSVDSLKANMDLKDNGDGTWNGTNDYEIANIKVDVSTKNALHLNIEKIIASNTYKNLNLSKTLKIEKEIRNIFKSGKPLTEEDNKVLIDIALSKSQGLFDDMSSASEINGFSFYEENNDPTQPRREIAFDKLAFQGASNGLGKEKATFNIKIRLNELKTSLVPAGFEGLAPEAFNFDITIADIPFKKIMETLINVSTKETNTNVMSLLPKMLQDSRSSIAIQNTFVKSADLNVDIVGKVDANASTPIGAVGTMTMSLKGLDNTVKKLQALSVKPGSNPQIIGYTGALAFFQMMGQSDKTDNGTAIRNYVFVLAPDGKLLLNNVDFNAIIASTMKKKSARNGLTATPK